MIANFDAFLVSAFGSADCKVSGAIGAFSNDSGQGAFSLAFKKHFDTKMKGVPVKDCTKYFHEVTAVKTQDEIQSLRVSGKFTEFIFRELIERVETVIDE